MRVDGGGDAYQMTSVAHRPDVVAVGWHVATCQCIASASSDVTLITRVRLGTDQVEVDSARDGVLAAVDAEFAVDRGAVDLERALLLVLSSIAISAGVVSAAM